MRTADEQAAHEALIKDLCRWALVTWPGTKITLFDRRTPEEKAADAAKGKTDGQ